MKRQWQWLRCGGLTLSTLGLCALAPATHAQHAQTAQAVRVALVATQTNQGAVAQLPLEDTAQRALTQQGLRVTLDAGQRAHQAELGAAAQSGKLPDSLTGLHVDAVASLQLQCTSDAPCSLESKVLAADDGDVVFVRHDTLASAEPEALHVLIEQTVAPALARAAQQALKRPAQGETWSLELTVTHVLDAEAARALAQPLARLPGVTAARAGAFERGTAKYNLNGRGRDQLGRLAAEIEADPTLALRVSYEAPRVLQAEYDVAKAYRRKVMVLAVAPENAAARGVLPELVRASLLNLPFLEMAHSLPLLATPDEAEAAETRLRAKAGELHVPLLLRASLDVSPRGASAKLQLIESGSGLTVVASGGEAESVAPAFDAAVRSLDAQFRVAVGHPEVRQRLGMQSLASSLERDTQLAISAFKLPTLSQAAQPPAPALLVVHNESREWLGEGRVTLSAGERELEQTELSTLAPGETRELPLSLEQAAQLTQHSLPLTAAVTYKQGGEHQRVSAVSPLIRVGTAADGGEAQAPAGYVALVREGVQRHVVGEWKEARDLFLRAHRMFPSARTLRSLGMVEFDLGHYAGSFEYLTQALTASVRPLDLDQRTEVRRLLSRLRASARPRDVPL